MKISGSNNQSINYQGRHPREAAFREACSEVLVQHYREAKSDSGKLRRKSFDPGRGRELHIKPIELKGGARVSQDSPRRQRALSEYRSTPSGIKGI